MIEVYERLGLDDHAQIDEVITLSYDQRVKGRLRVFTDSGVELGLFLDRGKPLLLNEFLKSTDGKIIQVKGQLESVAHASCDDWHSFSLACYHLGNRHAKLQVGERWLRFSPDHVLEEMVHLLGLVVTHEDVVFEPESGAYTKGSHSGHSHKHD